MNESSSLDLAATAARAIVLHCLLEFQTGHAKTIRVTKRGCEFSVSDDGRGHPIDKTVAGVSYLRFIYTHFDYPFEATQGAPIQLQGIGMSLITAMCSELWLTVRKHDETLAAYFEDGQLRETNRSPAVSEETGITVRAKLRQGLPADDSGTQQLEAWLQGVVQVHPTLGVFFNGRELKARH